MIGFYEFLVYEEFQLPGHYVPHVFCWEVYCAPLLEANKTKSHATYGTRKPLLLSTQWIQKHFIWPMWVSQTFITLLHTKIIIFNTISMVHYKNVWINTKMHAWFNTKMPGLTQKYSPQAGISCHCHYQELLQDCMYCIIALWHHHKVSWNLLNSFRPSEAYMRQ